MACIIKSPPGKGVVSFTTLERDKSISTDKVLVDKIRSLKNKWIIGLHHNWHDYHFIKRPLFDFSMAGVGDLKGEATPLIQLDACNFVPEYFNICNDEKFWDILYVARSVPFKRTPQFFDCIKKLLNKTDYRTLLICPILESVDANFFSRYDKMFSRSEKDRFTIIAPQHDYPFPYDTTTISFFYKHSKIFVHFADVERRCRTSAYAWACGMPVVSQINPASILPEHLRKEPYYYRVKSDKEYVPLIIKALKDYPKHDGILKPPVEFFSVKHTQQRLKTALTDMYQINDQNYNMSNLDIRLGRHHGLATGSNKIPMTLTQFVDILKDEKRVLEMSSHPDPEMAGCK